MRLFTLISIFTLLTGCFSALAIDTKSDYEYALEAIERADYEAGYRLLESYIKKKNNSTSNETKLKHQSIKLLRTKPALVSAAKNTFTNKSFKETIERHNGNALNAMSEEQDRLAIFHQLIKFKAIQRKQYKTAFSNFNAFFKKHKNTKRNINFIAKGNLTATNTISCVDINKLSSEHTPADIFTGVYDCISKDAPEKAVKLYAVALTYGHYDKLRMVDKTARGAISVLRFKLLSLSSKKFKEKFNAEMIKHSNKNKTGNEFKNLCTSILKLGKPNYYPTYMIKHGMAAFTGSASGILSDFEEEEAWEKSTQGFLKCS